MEYVKRGRECDYCGTRHEYDTSNKIGDKQAFEKWIEVYYADERVNLCSYGCLRSWCIASYTMYIISSL